MKHISDMLLHDPSLHCHVTSDCLEKVKEGNAVYLGVSSEPLLGYMTFRVFRISLEGYAIDYAVPQY